LFKTKCLFSDYNLSGWFFRERSKGGDDSALGARNRCGQSRKSGFYNG